MSKRQLSELDAALRDVQSQLARMNDQSLRPQIAELWKDIGVVGAFIRGEQGVIPDMVMRNIRDYGTHWRDGQVRTLFDIWHQFIPDVDLQEWGLLNLISSCSEIGHNSQLKSFVESLIPTLTPEALEQCASVFDHLGIVIGDSTVHGTSSSSSASPSALDQAHDTSSSCPSSSSCSASSSAPDGGHDTGLSGDSAGHE